MPEICRFYGITIRMYYDEHPPPHFHVGYLDVTRGALPRRALTLVLEWAMAHREELRQNWRRLERGEALSVIQPLE